MDKQTAKLVARIAENLPSELSPGGMQIWIDSPKELQKALRKALCPVEFKVFKTLKLGTGFRSADQFRKVLRDERVHISDGADEYLNETSFAVKETEVDLVVISVAELGFKKGGRRGDICERALSLGLEFCPAEVGPQLRLQYKDQPNGECLLVAMEPIISSYGNLNVFCVENDSGVLWLRGSGGLLGTVSRPDDRWVFLRRK